MIDLMIFSKNRPMQLHCLLSSLKEFSNFESSNINVLHKYDKKYEEGLNKVKSQHLNVNFIEESSFEDQVKDYLKSGQKYCVFFVDDMIVKNNFDINLPCNILSSNQNVLTFSLRLGTHLTYCYPTNSQQQVPNGMINSGVFVWNWKASHLDWNYPFSLDGHIFRRSDLEGWASHLKFLNPNQFEDKLQSIKENFVLPEMCVSYVNSVTFNMPLNRVQNEYKNRAEDVSVDELYDLWMNGKELDYGLLFGFLNNGAHHPLNLPIKDSK